MKLLILTQKIDRNDPTLGFFHRWVEEFSKYCKSVTVICLEKGEYRLPDVSVYSLGKERGIPRLKRLSTLYFLLFTLRKEYDAVFVHMNPEYVVLGGFLWKLWGKTISLWYTHKSVDLKLRLSVILAHTIFTASKESFRLKTSKLRIVGHGIDTDLFRPDPSVVREDWWLSAGRLNKSKRHDIAIREAKDAGRELRIAGEGPERPALETLARQLDVKVIFLGGVGHTKMPDLFRRALLFRHTSETGSADKVFLEALACGCPVKTNNLALDALKSEGSAGIFQHHSLKHLVPAIINGLK
ncbi:glycosyltransferase [Candidatus Kaiserbacteria bacterium]|nr:glycosyltransferase [Candidatus Kaiserbacteria bacterium]